MVKARFFADCSGDSVLRVSGAEHRWGRESRHEFGESHAPEAADRKTMGNSILIQLREIPEETHRPFLPPSWANRYDESSLPKRPLRPEGRNFWWLEVGGTGDTIADTESNRDELLKIAFGLWAHIENHPDGRGRRWELEWIGALPGKRENVRYVGDHILTQNDIEAGGPFDDIVAYGGWSMDDHSPAGIHYLGEPTIFHPEPSPYGIPYRSLYSRNTVNLFLAGRNISATHMALSSTRGMCSRVDHQLGLVVQALKEKGIYDDTALFVFSDHGDFTGDYGLVEKTQNTFEDCLTRVPLVLKPPKGVAVQPRVSDALVELVDLPATVFDLAGIEPPHTHFGKSLLPLVSGERDDHRDAVFCEGGRLRGERHAMELEATSEQTPQGLYWPRLSLQSRDDGPYHGKAAMCRTARFKYVRRLYESDELYDLERDPQELHNVVNDAAYSQVLAQMRERLLTWFMETADVVPFQPDRRF